jgi:hypothetical protein
MVAAVPNVGSPMPTRYRSPASTPSVPTGPAASARVTSRASLPNVPSAAAAVNSFVFEASVRAIVGWNAYSSCWRAVSHT